MPNPPNATLTDTLLDARDPVSAVREGLSYTSLSTVRSALFGALEAHSDAVKEFADALGSSERTLSRRKGGRLSTQESDRLLLVAETFDLAAQALDGTDRARAWMARPHVLLGGETPLARLNTLVGAHEVQTILLSIEHGMAA